MEECLKSKRVSVCVGNLELMFLAGAGPVRTCVHGGHANNSGDVVVPLYPIYWRPGQFKSFKSKVAIYVFLPLICLLFFLLF